MTSLEKYKKAMGIVEKLKKEILLDIQDSLENIPDISGVQRVQGTSINAFIISSKNLSSESWLPEFYDAKLASEKICKKVGNAKSIESAIKILKDIVESHKLDGIRMHPEVIGAIQKVVEKYDV